MKKIISVVCMFLWSVVVFGSYNLISSNWYNKPIVDKSFNFIASQDGQKVVMKWIPFKKDVWEKFQYYKVVRSSDNSNPVYSDDWYIEFSDNQNYNSYTDYKPEQWVNYYRVCAIFEKSRYCSNVEKISISNETTSQLSANTKVKIDKIIDKFNEKLKKSKLSIEKKKKLIKNVIEKLNKMSTNNPKLKYIVSYVIIKLNNIYDELIQLSENGGCEKICRSEWTKSEWWYNSCTNKLIKYDNCSSVNNETPENEENSNDQEIIANFLYPEFLPIINPYIMSSEHANPICDYGEIIDGVCLIGKENDRIFENDEIKIKLEIPKRILTTDENFILKLIITNKKNTTLRIGFGQDFDYDIGRFKIGSNVDMLCGSEGKSGIVTSECYQIYSTPTIIQPGSQVIWELEYVSQRDLIDNIIISIHKNSNEVWNIFSGIVKSSEYETCDGGDKKLNVHGKCCEWVFYIEADSCSNVDQYLSKSKQLINSTGYPTKSTFENTKEILLNELIANQYLLFEGREIVYDQVLFAKGINNIAVLNSYPSKSEILNSIINKTNEWLIEQKNTYNISDFGIQFEVLSTNIESINLDWVADRYDAVAIALIEGLMWDSDYDWYVILVDQNTMNKIWFGGAMGVAQSLVYNQRNVVVALLNENGFANTKMETTFIHEYLHNLGARDVYESFGWNNEFMLNYGCIFGSRNMSTTIDEVDLCKVNAAEIWWYDLNNNNIIDVNELSE